VLYVSFHEVMWIGHCSYQLFPLHHLENMHAARDNEKPEQARYKQRALRACGHVTKDRALYRLNSLTTPPHPAGPHRRARLPSTRIHSPPHAIYKRNPVTRSIIHVSALTCSVVSSCGRHRIVIASVARLRQ
jgi:hypothetical protein